MWPDYTRKWIAALLPFAVGLLESNIGSATSSNPWAEVSASLYYFPVVIAAISLGARAASLVGLVSGVSHGIVIVYGRGDTWVPAVAHTLVFVCVGLTAAWLSNWLRPGGDRTKGLPTDPRNTSLKDFDDESRMSALGRVVVGLVRQFRTPLTSIEGAAWLLQDARLPDDKRQEFVGILRKESSRLNRVLSEVLDFARPRKPRFRKVDLSSLVDEVIRLANPRDRGPLFLFRKDFPPDMPPVQCDPEQIKQVVLNLAANAIQASPEGGQIEISARVQNENVVIKVSDQGRGVSPELVDRIFDPFFTTHENCLGLGLAVAHTIVSEHSGKIALEPSSGVGTCVAVTLPLL
jgi:signal transduction histidine kinase